MKRLLVIFLTLIAVFSLATSANAGNRGARRPGVANGSTGGGPFVRLMELERRKNAALRSMIGR